MKYETMIDNSCGLADGCGYIPLGVKANKREKAHAMMRGPCTLELDELARPLNPDIVC